MATRGHGYASTYLRGRREQLESAVAQATATMEEGARKYEAEKDFYQKSLGILDDQILEYDKLLAKAISDREKLARPRTSRVTRGGSRESPVMSNWGSSTESYLGRLDVANQSVKRDRDMPPAIGEYLSSEVAKIQAATDPAEKQRIADVVTDKIFRDQLYLRSPDAVQSDTVKVVNETLSMFVPGYDLFKPDLATGKPKLPLSEEGIRLLDPSAREALTKQLEEKYRVRELQEAADIAIGLPKKVGATLGGGTYSVTRDELAPGEAERMKRIQSPEFQAVAKALRDDGVLSDAERAALEKAEINPDAYLDDALMQAVARTGLLMARRGELVGRQEQVRADLAALVEPDMSDERRRELTSMQYGPAGITPTDALLAPQKVKERMGEERERLSAKQALLQGVMRAASGDEFDLTEDENVYASQLAESVLGGNTAGVKQTYNQMREAGYDDDRIRSGFAVASRRAKELAARREAQAQAAAAQE